MTIKLITATALTLALAVPAFAQDTKATTGGSQPAPVVKTEAPKTDAKTAQPATTPAATTATKPVEAPKAAQPAPATAPVKADDKKVEAPKVDTKPMGVGAP